uniref:Viral CC-type chemokine n=1 Tax=Apapanepox virus TaxID=3049969 RepID=A0AAT9UPJ3_9POXV
MNKRRYEVYLLLFSQLLYLSFCGSPTCSEWCCEQGKQYEQLKYQHESCSFGCRLYNAKDIICKICNNCTLDSYSPAVGLYSNFLKECLSKCTPMPREGCKGECCEHLKMIKHQRQSNPNSCCDDIPMQDINTISNGNPISCKKSLDSCGTKGYLFLMPNNHSVCAASSSRHWDIGYKFNHQECNPISFKFNPKELKG